MKYMGSKRSMLLNGLGELISSEITQHDRLVDLFCGAASVSWFAAARHEVPVLSVDLQHYATALAGAVTERTIPIDSHELIDGWLLTAFAWANSHSAWEDAQSSDQSKVNTSTWVKRSRQLVESMSLGSDTIVTRSYGAHYYSLTQALILDGMIQTLPSDRIVRKVCLAATIITASQCAAAPGHTAQPFQPTRTASPFLREAWKRDPLRYAMAALHELGPKHATRVGTTQVDDAVTVASSLKATDLVFVDPPYSGVHYSRFYHVLETIARGTCGDVSGVGRYPAPEERPASAFSRKSESLNALSDLLDRLASSKCTVIFTFPAGNCSNGLSGDAVKDAAEQWFTVAKQGVKSRFSTLGGNNQNRHARQNSSELILLLRPRKVARIKSVPVGKRYRDLTEAT
jgi:adenine-specific DNA-methyltransferase